MNKILIIEDETAIAELEKDYLELSNFEVTICNDGLEGSKLALNGAGAYPRAAADAGG